MLYFKLVDVDGAPIENKPDIDEFEFGVSGDMFDNVSTVLESTEGVRQLHTYMYNCDGNVIF